jgi:HTH-type transcriptional regulator, competence development regulator
MKETLGEYIHNLRIVKGLTLTKLAAALDIDQSTLSKIENNKRSLAIETLPKVASIFGLDLGTLQKEYYSEKIAELIYREDNAADLLSLAQEKARYFKTKNLCQGDLNFTK